MEGVEFLVSKKGVGKKSQKGEPKNSWTFCVFEGENSKFLHAKHAFSFKHFFARLQNIIFGYAHKSSVPEHLPKIDCL